MQSLARTSERGSTETVAESVVNPGSTFIPSPKVKSFKMALSIEQAWKELTDEKNHTSWIVLKVDGKDIVFDCKGEGGLPEFKQKLHEDQLQFGAIRVFGTDSKERVASVRPKFIGVTWVGPKVSPMKRAGTLKFNEKVRKTFNGTSGWQQLDDISLLTKERLAKALDRAGGDQIDNYDFGGGEVVAIKDLAA